MRGKSSEVSLQRAWRFMSQGDCYRSQPHKRVWCVVVLNCYQHTHQNQSPFECCYYCSQLVFSTFEITQLRKLSQYLKKKSCLKYSVGICLESLLRVTFCTWKCLFFKSEHLLFFYNTLDFFLRMLHLHQKPDLLARMICD